jgi:hypothetical protein
MTDEDDGTWTRADWARWFIEHDDVGEAARVLEPGDGLFLGRSDYLSLDAALARRGLSASYDFGRVVVRAPAVTDPVARDLAANSRKPPARAVPFAPSSAKKTA